MIHPIADSDACAAFLFASPMCKLRKAFFVQKRNTLHILLPVRAVVSPDDGNHLITFGTLTVLHQYHHAASIVAVARSKHIYFSIFKQNIQFIGRLTISKTNPMVNFHHLNSDIVAFRVPKTIKSRGLAFLRKIL